MNGHPRAGRAVGDERISRPTTGRGITCVIGAVLVSRCKRLQSLNPSMCFLLFWGVVMKLELVARGRKVSRINHKRFFTAVDMAIVKHDEAIVNAQRKRGEVPNSAHTKIRECGCGKEGCFVHIAIPPYKM